MPAEITTDLVLALYGGIRAAKPFRDFLMALAKAVRAESATIVVERSTPDLPGAVFSDTFLERRSAAYRQVFEADPFKGLPPKRAVTMREHLGAERYATMPFMTGFMRGVGLQNVLGMDVVTEGGARIRLRAPRAIGAEDFGPEDKALFEALADHVAQATSLFLALDAAQADAALYADSLSRLAIGAVVVDRHCAILSWTPVAEDILRAHQLVMRTDEGLRLVVGNAKRQEFAASVERIARGSGASAQAWPIQVQGAEDILLSFVLRRAKTSARLDRPLKGAVLVTIVDLANRLAPSSTTLQRLFGLTPAEAELSVLLSQGMDLDGASAFLQISKNTAKAQLRMIFLKTGVTRQSSLVRLVLRAVDEFLPGAARQTGVARD